MKIFLTQWERQCKKLIRLATNLVENKSENIGELSNALSELTLHAQPESFQKEVDSTALELGRYCLNLGITTASVLTDLLRIPELKDLASRRILQNPDNYSLQLLFVYKPNQTIIEEAIKVVLKQKPSASLYGELLEKEELKLYWESLKKRLLSEATSSESLLAITRRSKNKDLRDEAKKLLIDRGMKLNFKLEFGKFPKPYYQDNRGEKFEDFYSVSEKSVQEILEKRLEILGSDVFDELKSMHWVSMA